MFVHVSFSQFQIFFNNILSFSTVFAYFTLLCKGTEMAESFHCFSVFGFICLGFIFCLSVCTSCLLKHSPYIKKISTEACLLVLSFHYFCVFVSLFVCTVCVYVCVCMCVCVYVCVCLCVCMCVCS